MGSHVALAPARYVSQAEFQRYTERQMWRKGMLENWAKGSQLRIQVYFDQSPVQDSEPQAGMESKPYECSSHSYHG